MSLTQHTCEQCELDYTDAETIGGGCPRCFARSLNLVSNDRQAASKRSDSEWSIDRLQPLFDGYEMLGVIGEGGMSVVVRARQTVTNRIVAIKILKSNIGDDGQWPARFDREIELLAGLSHPCIVAVHDAGQVEQFSYIVMEHVQGVSLRELIGESPLTSQEILKLIPDLCDGLQYIHAHGIVHRDIKPENIMVDGEGRAKLVDFGLSKMLSGDDNVKQQITRTQQVFGTPRYMAPEQFQSTATVDHRADLYSLGAVLYEMLTGEVPQAGSDPPSKASRRPNQSASHASDANHDRSVDQSLDPVVAKAMARNPDHRFQNAAELRSAFLRAFATQSRSTSGLPFWMPSTELVKAWVIAAVAGGLFAIGCGLFDSAFDKIQTSLREMEHGQFEYAFRSRLDAGYLAVIGGLLWFASGIVTQVALAGVADWSSATLPQKLLAPIHYLLSLFMASIVCAIPLILTLLWASVPLWVSVQQWQVFQLSYSGPAQQYWLQTVAVGCTASAFWTLLLAVVYRFAPKRQSVAARLHIAPPLAIWFCVLLSAVLGMLAYCTYFISTRTA